MPANIDLGYRLPAKAADGRFVTPSTGIGPAETMFHFRSALNVAALGCVRGANSSARDGYNAFLKTHKKVLATANKAIDAEYRRRFGSNGLRERDRRLTSLYNFYAYPSVKSAFCARTSRHLGTANRLASKDLQAYSASALADIEQAFQDYFADVERYQTAMAAWQAASAGSR